MRGSRILPVGVLSAIAAAALVPRRPAITSTVDPNAPPRRLRLSDSTRHICVRVGVLFNSISMPRNVYAYDVDEGWIELKDGKRLYGSVEPYWRQPESPPLSHVEPLVSIIDPPAPTNVDRLSAAEEKRARKAAKRAAALR
ncbi:hypothetical protein [Mesorhizobium sp.]|uniref:hypothetical protein n=1 Tax=Mesorhizobium sp. TaxID=1871066 RepID=UPI000FE76072|nr:hypothetical protein [Mesorhizobium sp.]RWE37451.1 MAG: hypothetical protein EOS77_02405 [Mesorhizobium sp.]